VIRVLLSVVFVLSLSACGRLDSILSDPPQTPGSWLTIQPFAVIKVGSHSIFLMQPSTTVVVYLLGLLSIGVGLHFLRLRAGQWSRFWWGIALVLWGIGALLAGTSYEAFSYAIKCAGREVCLWTSWWEVLYLILSLWSIVAMMLAVAYSSSTGKLRRAVSVCAILIGVLYFIAVIAGAVTPVKFLISFELLLAVAAPCVIASAVINGWRYVNDKQALDLACLGAWLWLGITIAAYFFYLKSGISKTLWANGVWFSENDVLHIGLILWMIYIASILAPRVKDIPVNATSRS
jgi:hypothetical protein